MENVKQGVKFYPMIDTERNFPGHASEFTVTLTNLVDGTAITNAGSGDATELIHDANGDKGTTDGAAAAGAKTVVVKDNTLVKGDVFDDGAGNLYTVKSVNGSTIGIFPELVADIADAVELDAVGNTGSYTFECQVDAAAKVAVDVFHPELGNVPFKYEVVEKTQEESLAGLEAGQTQIESQLSSLGATIVMKAVS